MSKPVVLALDLGSRTGWAVGRDSELLDSGVWPLPKPKAFAGERLMRLWQHLEFVREERNPTVVVVEGLVFGGKGQHAAHLAGAMRGVLDLWAYHHKLLLRSVQPSTLKKAAAGNGRADKAAMRAEASRRWHMSVNDHNHADALCLLGVWLDEAV